jgi:phage/plasmid primase-like uncharacterized protein
MPVAKAIRAEDPDRQIVFMADNDHHLPRRSPPLPNAGLEKAHEAAREVRGLSTLSRMSGRAIGTTLPPVEGGAQRPVR